MAEKTHPSSRRARIFRRDCEKFGLNQWAYYAALDKVSGGHWAPERDARPWVRFCLVAHNRQAKAFLRRVEEGARVLGADPERKSPAAAEPGGVGVNGR
jgi:hypothetical protein